MEAQWKARQREIRHEQRQTDLIIPPIDFARAVYHTSTDFVPRTQDDEDKVLLTDEALEVLQTACEASLLKLIGNSVHIAVNANRRIVTCKDMDVAAICMGLRDSEASARAYT